MKILLLLAIPVAEIILSIWLGKLVGGWMLLLWFVMAFFIGRHLMRGASAVLVPRFREAQQGGAASSEVTPEFLGALCTALGGVLFIVPGVLTDFLGVLMLLPPVQASLQGQMHNAFNRRGAEFMMMGGLGQSRTGGVPPFGQPSGSGRGNSQVFEGESREVPPVQSPVTATTSEVKMQLVSGGKPKQEGDL